MQPLPVWGRIATPYAGIGVGLNPGACAVGAQTITRSRKATCRRRFCSRTAAQSRMQGALAGFLLGSPISGADLDLDRQRDFPL